MTLWEFNACIRAYSQRQEVERKMSTINNWRTAALTGNAFAGKLKPISHYVKDDDKVVAPKITKEQQEEIDRKLAERRLSNGS